MRQAQGYGVGFALALAAGFAHRVRVEQQVDVVAMHAVGGVAHYHIAFAILGEQLSHRAVVEVAVEFYFHCFVAAGNGGVVAHENGRKHLYPLGAGRVNIGSRCYELVLNGFEEQRVSIALPYEAVAIFESLVVANEMSQIFAVALGYDLVHESAAFFACAAYQVPVHGRHHHQRYQPYVLAQALIFLAIALEGFALAFLVSHSYLYRVAVAQIVASEHHIVGIVVKHHLVGEVAAAFGEAEIVDGIEHIGFAHTIIAYEAIDVGREIQLTFSEILEIYY